MIVRSIHGNILVNTAHRSLRKTLEHCAKEGVDLSLADFRNGRLCGARLDTLMAPGASFRGSDLSYADLAGGRLEGCDFRNAILAGTCFAEADLSGVDFRGAYFENTLFAGAVLDRSRISCPSFWNCDVSGAASLRSLKFEGDNGAVFKIARNPIVIHGLQKRLVLCDGVLFWGRDAHKGALPPDLTKALARLQKNLPPFRQNAKRS